MSIFEEKIFTNMSLNTFLQFINILAPIIAVPILIDSLGLEYYGITVSILSISAFFIALSEMGLTNYASSKISIKHERHKLKYFFAINMLKILSLIFLFPFFILVFLFVSFEISYTLILFSYLFVILNCLSPYWYFLGMEKLPNFTFISFIGKLLFIAILVLFVDNEHDINIVLGAYCIGAAFPLLAITKINIINFKKDLKNSLRIVIPILKKTQPLFLSNIGIASYTSLNGFLIGQYLTLEFAGLYGAAERMVKGVQQITTSVAQGSVARLSDFKKIIENRKLIFLIFLTSLSALVLFYFFISDLAPIIGIDNPEIIYLSKLLSPVILFGTLSTTICLAFLIPLDDIGFMSLVTFLAGLFNCLMIIIIASRVGLFVAPLTIVFIEFAIMSLFILRAFKINKSLSA